MSNYRPQTTFSNPITKVGRTVYNVTLDMNCAKLRLLPPKQNGNMFEVANCSQQADDETLTVQPHELLLQQKDNRVLKRSMSRITNDTELMVLSALNGLKSSTKDLNAVRAQLTFAGVASTAARYSSAHRVQNDQVFVSQFGGLCTIQNTGHDPIRAGDWVVWDLPSSRTEGTNMCGKKEKQMVITRPYRQKQHSLQALQHMAHTTILEDRERQAASGTSDTNRQKEINENGASTMGDVLYSMTHGLRNDVSGIALLCFEIQESLREEQSRIIGRAMSSANEGDTFDLLLGCYSV